MLRIAVAVLTFARPEAMAHSLLYVIGAWAIVGGLLQIVASVRFRRSLTQWLMTFGGIASFLFGARLLAVGDAGIDALVYPLGGYAILFGISEMPGGISLRELRQIMRPAAETVRSRPR